MKYQLFPNLTLDEMEALTADIAERGVMVPVELDEDGAILDGHHRAMIADSLGITYPTVVREGWTEDQKLTHVVALNAHRRQLSAIERAEVVARLRQERMSTRAIAKAVGVGKDTVRRDLGIGAFAPMPDTITTADGRTYPATRPRAEREQVRDYIEDMPPAEQEWEREFRDVTRWGRRLGEAARLLVGLDPVDMVPRLDAESRRATERDLDLIERWLAKTRTELDAGAPMRLIGGKR